MLHSVPHPMNILSPQLAIGNHFRRCNLPAGCPAAPSSPCYFCCAARVHGGFHHCGSMSAQADKPTNQSAHSNAWHACISRYYLVAVACGWISIVLDPRLRCFLLERPPTDRYLSPHHAARTFGPHNFNVPLAIYEAISDVPNA